MWFRFNLGAPDLLMNSYLASKRSSFCVANLRNSRLFRASGVLNLNPFAHNLLRPEQIRGSLDTRAYGN